MITRFRECRFCIVTVYKEKILKKFVESEVGGGCWRYRGPIAMDDDEEWWIWAQYRDWLYPEEIGIAKMRENTRKMTNLARMWSRKIEIDL